MSRTGDRSPADRFRHSLAAATRALARNSELDIDRSPAPADANGAGASVPAVSRRMGREEVARSRGVADALALRQRLHMAAIHASFRPGEAGAAAVFDSLETARIEALGARQMPGVARNLDAALAAELRSARPETGDRDSATALAMRLALRRCATGAPLPPAAETAAAACPDVSHIDLDAMSDAIDSQDAFARLACGVLAELGYAIESGEKAEETDSQDEETEPATDDEESAMDPQEEPEAGDEDSVEQSLDAQPAAMGSLEDIPDAELEEEEDAPSDPAYPRRPSQADGEYRVYCRDFDEVADAREFCDLADLDSYRATLDSQLEPLWGAVGKLANRLQRRLQAQQRRSWMFDLEEGTLDTARLARIVVDPMSPLSFKAERESRFKNTVVTLLLDNSGSMRGRPITTAAICADILGRTLERCSVRVEILGFTTRAWKGGESRQKWIEANRPPKPGRLNDLRHIVYKSAETRWQRAKRNLGLMLREGILKENIDGEALQWAHGRLLVRPEQRKILMVISDGAPIDDSTIAVCGPDYLERHLRDVIAGIERLGMVELIAIGIGHDVKRYYRRAVTINSPDQLAGAITDQLADLFETENPIEGSRRRPGRGGRLNPGVGAGDDAGTAPGAGRAPRSPRPAAIAGR